MSIEDLRADLATNLQQAKGLNAMSTLGDVTGHLNNTLWPFLENLVTELADVDEGLGDLYHGAEDILQPETGELFATVIAGASGLVGELEKRLVLPADAKLFVAIKEWRRLAAESGQVLQEIVVQAADGNDEDDEEEDDEEDDDDDVVEKTAPQEAR